MSIHKGVIVRLVGSRSSGLALLEIDDERRGKVILPCENAPTVRNFEAAFGPGVILEGHRFDPDAIAGREIYYSVGDFGLFAGFTPVEEASPEMVAEYDAAGGAEEEAPRNRSKKGGVTFLGFLPPDDPIYSLGPIVAGRRILNSLKKKFH